MAGTNGGRWLLYDLLKFLTLVPFPEATPEEYPLDSTGQAGQAPVPPAGATPVKYVSLSLT